MFRQNATATNWLSKQSCDEKGYCYHQLDSSGHIIDINQAWLNLTGFEKKDVIGKPIHQFITPSNDTLPNALTTTSNILKQQSNRVSFNLKHKNKAITKVVLFCAPEYSQSHKLLVTHACFAPFEFFAQNKQHFLDLLSDMNEQQNILREHSHYLGDILNALDSFIMAFKGQQLISVNQPVLRFFGCETLIELIEKMPSHVYQELISLQQNPEDEQDFSDFVHIKSPVSQELHHFDVSHFIIENNPSNCITVLTDVTEKLKIKAQFNSEKELSSEYLNIAKIMILALDLNGNITQINQAGCELLGYPKNKIIGKNWFELFIPKEQQPMMLDYFNELIKGGDDQTHFNNENLIVTKDGAQRLISSNNTVLRNAAGDIIGSLSSAEDITDLKRSQEELAFLAHHDVLTGLDNRNSLQQRILQAIKKSQRSKNCFALCFIDLDNFKFINDSYGHKAGDELLIAVSQLIKKTVRDSDAVARFGGDEFVILLEDIEHNSEVSLIADKLLKAFSNPIHFDSHNLVITISMGVSVYPQDATTLDLLLKNADIAMYEAKRKGKNRYALYNKQMASDAINRATTIQELTKAITDGHIGVYYQPIINQITQKPVGIEALAR